MTLIEHSKNKKNFIPKKNCSEKLYMASARYTGTLSFSFLLESMGRIKILCTFLNNNDDIRGPILPKFL